MDQKRQNKKKDGYNRNWKEDLSKTTRSHPHFTDVVSYREYHPPPTPEEEKAD